MSEYRVRIVIERIDPDADPRSLRGVTITEIDSDPLETFSSQSSAEDFMQWVTSRTMQHVDR